MREGPLRITFCVLNLRMGGQVSNLTSLIGPLKDRGLEVQFALPACVGEPTKAALDLFSKLPFTKRLRAIWRMLRELPSGPNDVVHLVLPTAGFTPLAALLPTANRRILVHAEGLPTAWDPEHRQAFLDDPGYMLPRLILNHRIFASAARWLKVTQLASTPFYASWLSNRGFQNVVCVENLAHFNAEDNTPFEPVLESALQGDGLWVAYVGHAHPVKGVPDLIEAFALAHPHRPELHLLLALSSDGHADRIRAHLRCFPEAVQSCIHVTGLVPVARLLSRIDLLALPYRSLVSTTLYPSLMLEADEARCPLLVSRLPGLVDLTCSPSERLYLVQPRDPAGIAKALLDLPKRRDRVDTGSILNLPPRKDRIDRLVSIYECLGRSKP